MGVAKNVKKDLERTNCCSSQASKPQAGSIHYLPVVHLASCLVQEAHAIYLGYLDKKKKPSLTPARARF